MSINTCDRCDRDLKDPNAKYGWRCEKIMGGGSIYYQTRSPAKSTAANKFSQPNLETIKNTFPGKYLSQEEKFATFAKEFINEAVWLIMQNMGFSLWLIPKYIEQVKGTLFMLEELFTGKILPADFIVSLMENTVEGLGGDLFFVLTHLDWYNPNTELTKAETTELAKRTARAWEETAQLALIIYGAAKNASARKANAAAAAEGAGSKIINSVDDVSYGQSSIDKAFSKHSSDFGKYPDGSKASVELFKKDINNLLETGVQKSGTWYGNQGTHVYNPTTRQWAFFNTDGSFNTAFKLSPDQFKYLIETGVVK